MLGASSLWASSAKRCSLSPLSLPSDHVIPQLVLQQDKHFSHNTDSKLCPIHDMLVLYVCMCKTLLCMKLYKVILIIRFNIYNKIFMLCTCCKIHSNYICYCVCVCVFVLLWLLNADVLMHLLYSRKQNNKSVLQRLLGKKRNKTK